MKTRRPYAVMSALQWLSRYVHRCMLLSDPASRLPGAPTIVARPSLNRLREVEELQRRSHLTVTLPPAAILRRKQRAQRYMRNQQRTRAPGDAPSHIKEKLR